MVELRTSILVPRLCLGTLPSRLCLDLSANLAPKLPGGRRSLLRIAFPGRAWERDV